MSDATSPSRRPDPPASPEEVERFQRELARILAAVSARRLRRVA